MPTYTINGKRITTASPLTDSQIDEIAATEGPAASEPLAPAHFQSEGAADPLAGSAKFTGGGDPRLTPPPSKPAPWYSMRDTTGEYGGSSGLNDGVYQLPRWLGATAAVLGTGGTGLPAVLAAGLGGIGGKAVEQGLDAAQGNDSAPTTTSEALLQQGSAGLETGSAEALGQGGGWALGKLGSLVAPAEAATGSAPLSLREKIINKLRGPQLQEAAAHLQRLDEPHPLGKLEPHERGGLVGAQEEQVFKLRKQHGNKLYAPTDHITGVKLSELLDENNQLQVPPGVEIPPEIKSALTRVKNAERGLASAQESLAARQAKVRPGEIAGNDALSGTLDEAQAELDAARQGLDELPFSTIRKLRSNINAQLRATPPRHPNAGDRPALINANRLLTLNMEEAAHSLDPDAYAAWRKAEDFWGGDVAENHYRGPGREIGKKALKGDAQKISQVLEPFAPQDVTAAHKALVPGDWAPESARTSGQKAFDNLIEQRIATETGARNAGDKIDLTRTSKVIDSKIGTATWEEMKKLASPPQRARMDSLEKVARTYQRIGAAAPEVEDILADKAPGMIGKTVREFRALKPAVLRWALEHPARVELLTRDLDTAVGEKASELAKRNIATVVRMYEMDKGAPPSREPMRLWQ